jgi:hypothetical protein
MARRDLEEEDEDQTSWIATWSSWSCRGRESEAQRRGVLDDEGGEARNCIMV